MKNAVFRRMMVMSIVLPGSTEALVCACSDISKAPDPWLGQIHPRRGHPNPRAIRPEQKGVEYGF